MINAERARVLIVEDCRAIEALLLSKNERYGNSAFDPLRVFSQADTVEGIAVRMDDKLSRIQRGDLRLEDEDVTADLIGYLHLYRIAIRDARQMG